MMGVTLFVNLATIAAIRVLHLLILPVWLAILRLFGFTQQDLAYAEFYISMMAVLSCASRAYIVVKLAKILYLVWHVIQLNIVFWILLHRQIHVYAWVFTFKMQLKNVLHVYIIVKLAIVLLLAWLVTLAIFVLWIQLPTNAVVCKDITIILSTKPVSSVFLNVWLVPIQLYAHLATFPCIG
jgi:hypothetical protein